MKTVLLLSTTTGYQIRAFDDAASALGVRLVFASDRCDQLDDPWRDHAIPVRFHDEPASVDAVRSALGPDGPDGILAVGDRPVTLAAKLSRAWGLPGNPERAAWASRSKLESRAAFAEAGLLVPAFRPVPLADNPRDITRLISYPAVVKPLAMSGSRGVVRVNNDDELCAAFERLRRLAQEADVRAERDAVHDTIIVETFIPGREFAVEGVLTAGVLKVFAIFDKPDPLVGPFFEETIYVTPSRESADLQRRITVAIASATAALGLRHGPVHAECRVNSRGVYVLEVAARPIGGLCSNALAFQTRDGDTATLEEVLLRHTLGEDVGAYTLRRGAAGVMMIPIPRRGVFRSVRGEQLACNVKNVTDVRITAKRDALLVPLPEGRSYLGFIFARATTPSEVERALRTAHARLDFEIDHDIPIVAERPT